MDIYKCLGVPLRIKLVFIDDRPSNGSTRSGVSQKGTKTQIMMRFLARPRWKDLKAHDMMSADFFS